MHQPVLTSIALTLFLGIGMQSIASAQVTSSTGASGVTGGNSGTGGIIAKGGSAGTATAGSSPAGGAPEFIRRRVGRPVQGTSYLLYFCLLLSGFVIGQTLLNTEGNRQ
jgi:hypothetical protein